VAVQQRDLEACGPALTGNPWTFALGWVLSTALMELLWSGSLEAILHPLWHVPGREAGIA